MPTFSQNNLHIGHTCCIWRSWKLILHMPCFKIHRTGGLQVSESPNTHHNSKFAPSSLLYCLDRLWIESILQYILLGVCFKVVGNMKYPSKQKLFKYNRITIRENQWSDNQMELNYGKHKELLARTVRQTNKYYWSAHPRQGCLCWNFICDCISLEWSEVRLILK